MGGSLYPLSHPIETDTIIFTIIIPTAVDDYFNIPVPGAPYTISMYTFHARIVDHYTIYTLVKTWKWKLHHL